MADSRFRKEDSKTPRESEAAAQAGTREAQDVLTDDELDMEDLLQEALPDLPSIPGFHLCWLSATNAYDTIPKRMRLGYVPVKPEEVPGFEYLTLKGTQHEGMIGWNEMIAFKIPLARYQRIMTHLHHTKPMQDEEAIRSGLEEKLQDSGGQPLIRDVGDGMEDLGERIRPPRFEG